MGSKFMSGSEMLQGDNKVPGLKLPDELAKLIPTIFDSVKKFGCDCYPTVVQMLTYDEMSEVAAYGGFPVRYPHWKWGMEYEELARGYEYGMHRIYEMVINTVPCYIYCLDSNTLVDNVTVVAHALGHNDFFKNNIFFSPTSQSMLNQMANHGTRIRRYMSRWGKEKVTEFIDHVMRLETMVDPKKAWEPKIIKDVVMSDERTYQFPRRLNVENGHDYMDPYLNEPKWVEEQREKTRRAEIAKELELFNKPTRDILGFLRDHAPLKMWQADIVSMLYEEALYYAPQRLTHMMNEGWASYIDFNMMAKQGMCGLGQASDDCGIVEYAAHKMGVLGGKYSLNPYKIGFCIFQDIEERWNKGQFGSDYDECKDMRQKKDWDLKLGLGHEKVLEVRKFYNDAMFISEFFTEEFCNKYEFFEWKWYPNGETKIESRDYKKIKAGLMQKHLNGGLPDLQLVDPNFKGKGYLLIQHQSDGRCLYEQFIAPVLQSMYALWGNNVYLASKDKDGEEIIWCADGSSDEDVHSLNREELEDE